MGDRPGVTKSAYEAAEERLQLPPVRRRVDRGRGLKNQNPPELSFWQLLREDLETHEYDVFEQGFWAVANHRFGNWRLGLKNPLLRVPCSLAYGALEKGIRFFGGITLPCGTRLGRRVRLWSHGGMIIGARAIGSDVRRSAHHRRRRRHRLRRLHPGARRGGARRAARRQCGGLGGRARRSHRQR
jgi:hypothetical protein